MLRYRKWVLSLGIMIVTPGMTMAGPFSLLGGAPSVTKPSGSSALSNNQKMANKVAVTLRKAKLQGHNIGIECKRGVVSIQGEIATSKQKAKVTKLISRISGVKHVDNRLVPLDQQAKAAPGRPPKRNVASLKENTRKAREIAKALSKAPLSSADMKVEYKQGVVRLTGTVKDQKEHQTATMVASKVPGVIMVDNKLGLATGPKGPARGPVSQVAYNQPPGAPPSRYQPAGGPPMRGPGPQGYQPAGGPPMRGPGPQGYQPAGGPPMRGPGPQAGYQPAGGPAMGMPPRHLLASQPQPGPSAAMMGAQGVPSSNVYNQPRTPGYAWPSYAASPNYAQVAYPKQYSASAWPYIGPFYPYPQVPLGWRKVQLEWDDGNWSLNFDSRTDKWWWFMNPHNWGD